MPDKTLSKVPKYRLYKPRGLGLVRIKGRNFYLGKYGTPESLEAYQRIVSEWTANHGRVSQANSKRQSKDQTIDALFVAYWSFVKGYYLKNGRPTGEQQNIRDAYRPLKALYGSTPANEFGARSLKAVRQKMIDDGLSRGVINARVNRIRRMFKWGVENELVDAGVLHALQAVASLKRGRSSATETNGVAPVPEPHIEATVPFLATPVQAMVRLQLLTGMRSGEVTAMRGQDLDTTGRLWTYRPSSHKTEHHSIERVIYLGPKAQTVVKPFLKKDLDAYLFSPAEADAERRAKRHAARKTPLSCGNLPGTRRRPKPKTQPGNRYTTNSYRQAIRYACDQAFPAPPPIGRLPAETVVAWTARLTAEQRQELKAWRKAHSWHPHQLRHNAATRLRKEFGIEAARVVLGHRSAGVTEIYAEIDHLRAADVMGRVG